MNQGNEESKNDAAESFSGVDLKFLQDTASEEYLVWQAKRFAGPYTDSRNRRAITKEILGAPLSYSMAKRLRQVTIGKSSPTSRNGLSKALLIIMAEAIMTIEDAAEVAAIASEEARRDVQEVLAQRISLMREDLDLEELLEILPDSLLTIHVANLLIHAT